MTGIWKLRIAAMLQIGAMGMMNTFDAVRMKDAGLSEDAIGQIIALSNGLIIISALAWGRLADSTGQFRRCIGFGTVGLALTLLWFGLAQSPAEFVVYAVLRGILGPSIMSLMSPLALANIDPDKQGQGFGGYRRFGSLGFISSMILLPLLFQNTASFMLAGAAWLPISIFLLKGLDEPAKRIPDPRPSHAQAHTRIVAILFLLAHFTISLAEPGMHSFLNAYARDLGASLRLVGIISSVTGVIALISLPWMGRLCDKWGAQTLLFVAFAAQSLRMLTISFINDPALLWLPHLFHSFGWAGREVATLIFLTSLLGKGNSGKAASLIISIRMAGAMLGAFLMGLWAQNYGYPFMFRSIAAFASLSIPLLAIAAWKAHRPISPSPLKRN